MTDVGSHHFVKAGTGSHSALVPQPSDDEHDPLNWGSKWKGITVFGASMTSFVQGIAPLSLAPMFGDYIQALDSNLTDVVQFTGVTILVLGFSNFLWVPLQACFGRRPVLIVSTAICLASAIWRAEATTYNSFMRASALNGIGAGVSETAQPTITVDVIFLHNRGKFNTLYFVTYFGALMVGPVISGPMAAHVGWRNFWWLVVGMHAFCLIWIIFLFPETKFHSPYGTTGNKLSNISPLNGGSKEIDEAAMKTDNDIQVETSSNNLEEAIARPDPYLGRGKPSKQQWKLWQPYEGNLFQEFIIPWELHLFPIVQFAAFIVSFTASCFLTLNLTQTQAFAAPPYNFDSQTIGFFNFAILI